MAGRSRSREVGEADFWGSTTVGGDSMAAIAVVVRGHQRKIFPAHADRYRPTVPNHPESIFTLEQLLGIVRPAQATVDGARPPPTIFPSRWLEPGLGCARSSGIKPLWLPGRRRFTRVRSLDISRHTGIRVRREKNPLLYTQLTENNNFGQNSTQTKPVVFVETRATR